MPRTAGKKLNAEKGRAPAEGRNRKLFRKACTYPSSLFFSPFAFLASLSLSYKSAFIWFDLRSFFLFLLILPYISFCSLTRSSFFVCVSRLISVFVYCRRTLRELVLQPLVPPLRTLSSCMHLLACCTFLHVGVHPCALERGC